MRRRAPVAALSLLLAGLAAGCGGGGQDAAGPPIIAPTLGPSGERIVLRRCDDGGDGGVLIDGVCL